jgi:hypothetical protein
VFNSPAALGKNLSVLVRVLYAAFLAEQTSMICATWTPVLSEDDKRIFAGARSYSQLIKRKVTSDLSDADIDFVLKSAADRAKFETGEAIKALRSLGQNTKVRNWLAGAPAK